MWLLSTERLELRCFNGPEEPGYAILSHVWDDTEQSFMEIQQLQLIHGVTSYGDHRVSKKVRECVKVAKEQGFAWVWDDTCCIDKRSSAELEEAINSMFQWYTEAAVCLAYLKDVPDDCFPGEPGPVSRSFRNSVWFKRGWTLQELLAPRYLVFLSEEWNYLGTRAMLADVIQEITGIDAGVLTFRRHLQHVPVATRMSWAANRQTKRIEDQAYSLLGIFEVSMSTIYGEGSYAFQRLQAKVMKRHADHTLFAW
ncbi:HET-domain-containing protein, partial [Trametes versicolor FP-101664 SS1]|uniref:HET-domain-containing protein n=1 Tax=Trametes versicolor (strain FP-101664) TaxID=717944 RepID=UPI0004622D30